jgi:hypothetical protein
MTLCFVGTLLTSGAVWMIGSDRILDARDLLRGQHEDDREDRDRLREPRRVPATLSVEQVAAILAAQSRLRDRFLLALLAGTDMAAVRPECQVDVYPPLPGDPVLFGPTCLVAGCDARGLQRAQAFARICARRRRGWGGAPATRTGVGDCLMEGCSFAAVVGEQLGR